MDFEDIRASFQNHKFEGYLFETPPAVVATEIRRAAEMRQQRFDRRRIADQGIMIILAVLSLVLVILQSTFMARAGAALVMLTLILQGLSVIRKIRMDGKRRFDLPPRISLLEERKCVVVQMREARLQSTLYLLPSVLGGILLCLSRSLSEQTVLGFVTGMLLGVMIVYCIQARRIRKELLPRLDRINRELAEIDANSPSPPGSADVPSAHA
jgi:hypothetical protein